MPELPKLLITNAFKATNEQLAAIQASGWSILIQEDERAPLADECLQVDAIICNRLFDHHDIRSFGRLKLIQLTSAGMDQIPMEIIAERQIQLCNAKAVYSIPIAEWAILKILEIYKQARVFNRQQENHQWIKQREICELAGKTALIVGFGEIGIEISKRLQAFGVHVIGIGRRYVHAEACDEFALVGELDHYLERSDIVIITLPLNEQTYHLFNAQRLMHCKTGSLLINLSRGKVIDENDLLQTIKTSKFMGVALDVFEEEPLAVDSPLWDQQQVIITPHNAFMSENNLTRLSNLIMGNLEQFRHSFPTNQ